ncbi:dienelactone hydrolase [Rhizocola hellebori]|uniref:Dienelactone hydrolase n=1 Tax=Rhizocola hellebori TaxID=1392758 RepID=A0A8J3Q2M6_9ACTN|nr:dienelactone hydrolase family protein [Rhizocola hellebori]GIH02344.1 dienelactone hydrolase [Rhizocola hellebori]
MFRRAALLLVTLAAFTGAGAAPASAADTSAPGPFVVAYTDASVTLNGRSFTTRYYYPGTSTAQNAPVAAGEFPAIAFGHGFFQAISKYTSTVKHLASWGFIVGLPNTQTGLSVNHGTFADEMNASLSYLVAQDAVSTSRFYQHVRQDKLGLSGHSMGGGASVLAASRNPAVTAVANLAAAETTPSAVTAAATLSKPMMLVAGDRDTIAGISGNQRPIYNSKLAPKQLRTIRGGFHCGFIDSTGLFCDSGSITRAVQLQITRRLLTDWFRYYLAGDTASYDLTWGTPAQTDPQVIFEGVA